MCVDVGGTPNGQGRPSGKRHRWASDVQSASKCESVSVIIVAEQNSNQEARSLRPLRSDMACPMGYWQYLSPTKVMLEIQCF